MKKFIIFIAVIFCGLTLRAQTLSGLDVLEKDNFLLLKGKRVGLLTNHTAINKEELHIVELMLLNTNVNLTAIFSPEHGFLGVKDHGEICPDECYNGINVYSLYSGTKRILPQWFDEIDVLVFDIQDVGSRYYTYLASMAMAMEDAAKHNVEFIVLDRPNPISAAKTEGPVLEEVSGRLTAYFPFPVRHGFTPAEAAMFYADKKNLPLPTVIRMENYTRDLYFDETGLPWTNPSPNIRSTDAEILYSGIGIFEASNLSVGRGTDSPFMHIGAPWLKADKVVELLNKQNIKGVNFMSVKFTPQKDVFAGRECNAIEFEITDRQALNTFDLFVYVACAIRDTKNPNFSFKPSSVQTMTGTKDFLQLFNKGLSAPVIIKQLNAKSDFSKQRAPYLLY